MPAISHCRRLGEGPGIELPEHLQRECGPAEPLDLRPLSRSVKQHISIVLSLLGMVHPYGSPRKQVRLLSGHPGCGVGFRGEELVGGPRKCLLFTGGGVKVWSLDPLRRSIGRGWRWEQEARAGEG